MKDWQLFEVNSTNFLNTYYKTYNIKFENIGGSDSTISDIKIYKDKNLLGMIEAKYIPSQSGQIVVLLNDNKFIYSDNSQNKFNKFTKSIVDYINDNFQFYKGVGTKGLNVGIDTKILFNWIKEAYINKKVSWIISSNVYQNLSKNNLLLIPLNDMEKYFEVSAVLRKKKSGTAHLPQSDINIFMKLLEDLGIKKEDYQLQKVNKKYLLKLSKKIDTLYVSEAYFLSKTDNDNEYYVKKRSGTNNPNIVFSLVYKNGLDFKDKEFKEFFHL